MAYGDDAITKHATSLFQDLCGTDVDVLFTFNGTGSNIVALGSLLHAAESVICSEWAHIHVDETGAPEHILGVKLQDVEIGRAHV
jgi:threonine aldolase